MSASSTSVSLAIAFPDRRHPMRQVSEAPLRQSSPKLRQMWANEPTSVAERLVAFLRERHPVKTIDCIAAETGLARTTVAKWFERAGGPSASAFLALVSAYGPDVICAAMQTPPDWLVAAKREARRAALTRELSALEDELASAGLAGGPIGEPAR